MSSPDAENEQRPSKEYWTGASSFAGILILSALATCSSYLLRYDAILYLFYVATFMGAGSLVGWLYTFPLLATRRIGVWARGVLISFGSLFVILLTVMLAFVFPFSYPDDYSTPASFLVSGYFLGLFSATIVIFGRS